MFDFKDFRDEWKTIEVFIYKEADESPYEKNKIVSTYLNSFYIKAIIREVSAEQLTWQLFGLKNRGAKELLTDVKNKQALEHASLIKIDGVEYQVFKEANSKRVQIQTKGNYIVAILEKA